MRGRLSGDPQIEAAGARWHAPRFRRRAFRARTRLLVPASERGGTQGEAASRGKKKSEERVIACQSNDHRQGRNHAHKKQLADHRHMRTFVSSTPLGRERAHCERPDPPLATTGRDLPQRTAEGRVMTKSIIAIKTERFRLAGAFTNKEKNCHACTYTPIR